MRCTARRTDGEPCGNHAIKGGTVCRYHGGSAPQVQAAAKQRLAEAEARKAMERYTPDRKPMENPVEALLSLASEIEGWRDYLAARVSELEQADWRRDHRAGEQLNAMISLYERSLDRAAKVLVDLGKLGIQDRLARLHEAQALMVLTVIQGVLNDLDLSPEQRAKAATAVPARLRELEASETPRPVSRGVSVPVKRER
jgi:hypothetical protein